MRWTMNYTNSFMAKLEMSPCYSEFRDLATLVNEEHDAWSEMLPDMLGLISDRLPLADFLAFRRVCRSWRLAPSGRTEIFKFKKDDEWLMFYDVGNNGDDCYIYSKTHPACCTLRLPDLRGATIVESKNGWFLAHRDGNFFFFNPFSHEKMEVGPHRVDPDQASTFTGTPTRPGCTVYILSGGRSDGKYEMSRRSMSDSEWSRNCFGAEEQDRTIAGILACCCMREGEGGGCNCCCEKAIFVIFGSPGGPLSSRLYYLDTKRCSDPFNFPLPPAGLARKSDSLGARHGGGWLRKFGDRGISLSSLSRHHPEMGVGLGGRRYRRCAIAFGWRLGDCGEAGKAAWVQPRFASKRERDCGVALKAVRVEPWVALQRVRKSAPPPPQHTFGSSPIPPLFAIVVLLVTASIHAVFF